MRIKTHARTKTGKKNHCRFNGSAMIDYTRNSRPVIRRMHNNIIDPKRKPQFGFCSVLYNFHLSLYLFFSLTPSHHPPLPPLSLSHSLLRSLSLSLSQCLFYRVTTAYTVFDNFTDDPRLPTTPSRKIIEYYYVHARTLALPPMYMAVSEKCKRRRRRVRGTNLHKHGNLQITIRYIHTLVKHCVCVCVHDVSSSGTANELNETYSCRTSPFLSAISFVDFLFESLTRWAT